MNSIGSLNYTHEMWPYECSHSFKQIGVYKSMFYWFHGFEFGWGVTATKTNKKRKVVENLKTVTTSMT